MALGALRLFDFLCEHTLSESRLLALVGARATEQSLVAVLTCEDLVGIYEAQALLRRVLATRDAGALRDELEELAAELPEAAAASLLQAAVHAAQGRWPAAAVTFHVTVLDELQPSGDAAGFDVTIETDQESARHPRKRTTRPRLKDLPGKVIRIAWLREYHVTDETRLLLAARARDWEPIPAPQRPEDDPRDLLGAVTALAEEANIPGTQTIEEQSTAQLLRTGSGDEVAGWSATAIVETFQHGFLQHSKTHVKRPDSRANREPPDMAALFPLTPCTCGDGQDDACEDCEFQLTPRTADLLHSALTLLADEAYDDARELGDEPLAGQGGLGEWSVFRRLPKITWRCDLAWRLDMARTFDDLAVDLSQGRWPEPTCTAEEMALHLALAEAPGHLEGANCDTGSRHHGLPTHPDDYNWDLCAAVLFQDADVLMLFNPALDGIEDPDSYVNKAVRIGDLRPVAWFKPFGNLTVRDPRRGHRP